MPPVLVLAIPLARGILIIKLQDSSPRSLDVHGVFAIREETAWFSLKIRRRMWLEKGQQLYIGVIIFREAKGREHYAAHSGDRCLHVIA